MASLASTFINEFKLSVTSLKNRNNLLKTFCFVSLLGITCSVTYGTDLRIRAQDDVTEGGLKLSLHIPIKLQDGPKGGGIEVISEDNEKAIRDQDGNFLDYKNVDLEGNKAPELQVKSLMGRNGEWPPTSAKVMIPNFYDRLTPTQLPLRQTSRNTFSLKHLNFTYYLPPHIYDVESALEHFPFELELRDSISVEKMPFFDSVSVFGTIWNVLAMYTKDLADFDNSTPKINTAKLKWTNKGSLRIFPHMSTTQYAELYPRRDYNSNLSNAFYEYRPTDPKGNHVLCFFPIIGDEDKYTSQSFDVVAHEGGHYVLNILRPELWDTSSRDVKAFHETFGDMTAFFSVLSFSELRNRILRKTNGNLHKSSFLSVIGESIVNRDANECTNISLTPLCEEHDLSERLTRALYGTFADLFNITRADNPSNLDVVFEQTTKVFRTSFLKTVLVSNLSSFIDFGRSLKSAGTTRFGDLVHANFLRQAIDLTDIHLSPQVCSAHKHEISDQSEVVGCTTGKMKDRYTNANSHRHQDELRYLGLQ